MKRILKVYFSLFFTILIVHSFAFNTDADGIVQPMQPPRLVNDFANMLNSNEEQQLETKLLDYNDSTSTQIYIVTIDSLQDYSVEDYALRLGRSWAIGQKNKNNGVLILLSKSDRKVDIEIGYGLESSISDYDSKHIIDELIVPAFKSGNYYAGLDAATTKMIALAQGAYSTPNEPIADFAPISIFWIIAFVLIIIYLMYKFPLFTRIVFMVISSSGSNSGSSRGFGGGGGGSFGGGGSSGSW
jgi:uncharacterized protein